MENRQDTRYDASEYLKEIYYSNISAFIEADSGQIKANIVDISLNGIGFEILFENQAVIEFIFKTNNFFIKLQLASHTIICEITKKWQRIVSQKKIKAYKGGFTFSIISPDDRLKIADFVDKLRHTNIK